MAWSMAWWLSMSNKFNQTIQIFAAGNFSNEIVQTLDILMQYSVHSTPSRFILRVCTARNIFHGKRLKHNTKKKVIRLSWKPALPAAVRGNFSPPPRPVQSWQHTLHSTLVEPNQVDIDDQYCKQTFSTSADQNVALFVYVMYPEAL